MSDRKRILNLSILVMAGGMFSAAAVAISTLYRAAFEEERTNLVEIARGQARFMEAVARFDATHSHDAHPNGAEGATLSQIADARKHHRGFGRTGEFVIARREGDQIVFLFPYRHGDGSDPDPVPWASELAQPMRLALSGEDGAIIGLDYRGEQVLAAHEPVAALNFGVVAKMDVAEIRARFVTAALIAAGATVLLVLVGVGVTLRVTDPLLRRLGLFQRFAEESGHGLAMADLNRRITYVNPALCRMLGVERPEDVLGKTFDRFYPEEARRRVNEEILPTVLEKGQWNGELAQISKKGGVFPTIEHIFLIRGEKGAPACLANVMTDITERKRAEDALRESEARFHALFQKAPLGYQSLDEDGCFLEVNQAWSDMLGFARDEVIGRWFGDFLAPEHRELFKHRFPLFQCTGHVRGVEFKMIRKNGSHVIIAFDGRIGHDDQGRFKQTHCILQNITRCKHAEEALRRSEHIVSSSTDMLAMLDENYVYLAANEAYLKAIGKTRDELIGNTAAEIFGQEFFETTIRPNAEPCLAGEEVRYEEWFDFPGSGRQYMDIAYSPYVDTDGQINGFVVCERVATERKRSEKHLTATVRDLERFNRLAVGREGRMIELKREVNELARKAGVPPPYDSDLVAGIATPAGQPIPQTSREPSGA